MHTQGLHARTPHGHSACTLQREKENESNFPNVYENNPMGVPRASVIQAVRDFDGTFPSTSVLCVFRGQ